MAKFNIAGAGSGNLTPAADLVEQVPQAEVSQAASETPKILQNLEAKGLLAPEQAAAPVDPVAPPVADPAEVVDPAIAEQEREAQRIEPLAQRIQQGRKAVRERPNRFADAAIDPFQAQLDRAKGFGETLAYDADSGKDHIKAYVTPNQQRAVEAGLDPFRTDEGAITSPVGPLTDQASFAAASYSPETGLQVDPVFSTVASIITEKYFATSDGKVDGVDYEPEYNTDINTGEEVNYDAFQHDEAGVSKASGNERLGRQVYEEFMREKANREGLPTDEYLINKSDPSREDFEYVGALAKETYASANPGLIGRTKDEKTGQILFTPKSDALRQFRDADLAADQPFDGIEVKPGIAATPTVGAQPAYEAGRRVRDKTKALKPQPEGKNLDVMNEARSNMNSVGYVIDARAEGMTYQTGMHAVKEAFDYYHSADNAIKEALAQNPDFAYWNQPAVPSGYFSNIFGVGNDKLGSFFGKKIGLEQEAKTARAEADKARATSEWNADSLEQTAQEAKAEFLDFSPMDAYRNEINKAIESLNTVSNYTGQSNHLTYSIQMGTGRANVQQNKFNPQNNKIVRFAARQGGKPVRVDPNGNSQIEANFKEIMAIYFLNDSQIQPGKTTKAKNLHVKDRIALFNRVQAEGGLAQLIAMGKELTDKGLGPAETEQARKLLQGIVSKDKDGKRLINIPNELSQFQPPTYSGGVKAELAKHKAEEAPYIMEALMDLYQWSKGAPFNTRIEPEMDGITHGITSNGAALGIDNTMLRGGVYQIGDVKQMVNNSDVVGDLRAQMSDQMATAAIELSEKHGGENAGYFQQIAEYARADGPNYLKKAPMTFIYGQELKNLSHAVKDTMYVGDSRGDIKRVMQEGNLDQKAVGDFLHELLVETLITTLTPEAIAVSRQLRANNVLSILSGEVMYYDNAMGFRNWIGGSDIDTEQTLRSSLSTVKGKKSSDKPVYHYREEPHGAAARPGYGVGGYGHGRIIPSVVQAYDGNMIARTFSGKGWDKIQRNAAARGYDGGALPIFDATKTNLANFDTVREVMNENWWDGIEGTSFVGEIMGEGGWFDKTLQKTNRDLSALNAPIALDQGQFRGLWAFIQDEAMQKQLVSAVYPVDTTNSQKLLGKDKSFVKEVVKELNAKVIADFDSKVEYRDGTPFAHPQDVRMAINGLLKILKIPETNRSIAEKTANARKESHAKVKKNQIMQVDAG